ncbi:cytochrome b/b6 domain-containing protein [Rubrivivax sp. JA1055]|uniref:cytochrome b/b6 domain-containing protein n=1 Tax=Rubrivivax sp. JA1055 TaxID=2894194 RepID=UPI001E430B52|nr:cytochrome b/b6 domain-containing protein [Rubrivivax sp. JA1055]MCC9598688.1 cytochrome b/b6 domain-containing protein [Rubrivivax sp. JA1055]
MNASNDRQRRLVWDLPVRLFHGLIVVCFAGAWLTSESERHALLHETLGYTLAGLIVWRLVWGLVGTRHARFGDFVTGPGAVLRYLKNVARRTPEHHVGHNPASALAIVVLLVTGLVLGASGWALQQDVGGEWVEELHELAANVFLLTAIGHVVGVLLASRMTGENLPRSMVDGLKIAPPEQAIRSSWRSVAALLLAAVLGFWVLQWRDAGAADADAAVASAGHHGPARQGGAPDGDDD